MIKKEDIRDILNSARQDWPQAGERDIAFAVLCDTVSDKAAAYKMAYGKAATAAAAAEMYKSQGMQRLLALLGPFGVGSISEDTITREDNMAGLIKLLKLIPAQLASRKLSTKEAITLETTIRTKLNDKFEMEAGQTQKRIIIVPQKHDMICPHTNRECTSMPTKEACMKYYGLKDGGEAK